MLLSDGSACIQYSSIISYSKVRQRMDEPFINIAAIACVAGGGCWQTVNNVCCFSVNKLLAPLIKGPISHDFLFVVYVFQEILLISPLVHEIVSLIPTLFLSHKHSLFIACLDDKVLYSKEFCILPFACSTKFIS